MPSEIELQPVRFDGERSCLFIGPLGKLFRVHCPFRVVCQTAYPPYLPGEVLVVSQVGEAHHHQILFKIGLYFQPHQYFMLHL